VLQVQIHVLAGELEGSVVVFEWNMLRN